MVTRIPPRTTRQPTRQRFCFRLFLASGAAATAMVAGSVVPLSPLLPAAPQAQAAPNALNAPAAADGKKVLTVAVDQSIDSLSPFLAQTLVATSVHRLTYEYLTNYDAKDARTVPGFATKWVPSADKLTWTFTIAVTPSGPTASRPPPRTRRGPSTR